MSFQDQAGREGPGGGVIALVVIVVIVALGFAAFVFRRYGESEGDQSIDECQEALGSEGVRDTQSFGGEDWLLFNRELEAYGLEPMADIDELTGDDIDAIEQDYQALREDGIEVFLIAVEYEDGSVGYCAVENDQEAGSYTVVTAVDPV